VLLTVWFISKGDKLHNSLSFYVIFLEDPGAHFLQ